MGKALSTVMLIALTIVVSGVFAALPVMLFWNWLMPTLFGLTTITFWQALGLAWLCGLLFKSSSSSSKKD